MRNSRCTESQIVAILNEVHADRPLRHPLEEHLAVEALLRVLTPAVKAQTGR